jgi:hypothetical protein
MAAPYQIQQWRVRSPRTVVGHRNPNDQTRRKIITEQAFFTVSSLFNWKQQTFRDRELSAVGIGNRILGYVATIGPAISALNAANRPWGAS